MDVPVSIMHSLETYNLMYVPHLTNKVSYVKDPYLFYSMSFANTSLNCSKESTITLLL